MKSTLKLLSALGHEIVEATLPFDKEQWLLAFMTILAGETQSDIRSASALAGCPLGFKDFEASTYIAGLLGSAWSGYFERVRNSKHLQHAATGHMGIYEYDFPSGGDVGTARD